MLSHAPRRRSMVLLILFAACLFAAPVRADQKKAELKETAHPFLLWNRDDIQQIKDKIEREPWAKKQWETLLKERGQGETHRRLLQYLVTGDRKVVEGELKYLLSFRGAKVDPRPWSDNHLSALRYDVLYDLLTKEQREQIEATFRKHIDWELENDKRTYTKHNWLPNMQWCRKISTHVMAVAMQDEKRIRALFNANGGWKYYFDDYISDGQFYNEEFNKQYSVIGKMLLWCRGLERLGLNELGYGYTGTGGATMKRYLQSYFTTAYPRVDLGTDRPHYPRMTMGDAKGGWIGYAFQSSVVQGRLMDGSGGKPLFRNPNMNGRDHRNRKVDQFLYAGWWEIAHAKWPEDHFDYFLAQMRAPGEDKYIPTMLFGWEPIDPKEVTPPKAASGVYPERGIAMLRMDESPEYWASALPALGFRMATPYVHEVPDCFSIIGYYAHGRPIYINRQVAGGYAGRDPGWSNSIRSHSGVVVDNEEPRRIGITPETHHFSEHAKYMRASAEGVYPGVEMSRSFVLTDYYLFDVYALESSRPRAYQWMVQTLGQPCPDNPGEWAETRHLIGSIYDLEREQSFIAGDDDWTVTSVQQTAGADRELSGLGKRWFDAKVGVRMTMLGESGTVAYLAKAPSIAADKRRLAYGNEEPGGVTILAGRNKRKTAFVALHEPFKEAATIAGVREIARDGDAAAYVITQRGGYWQDIVLLAWGDKAGKDVVLRSEVGAFKFKDFALIRSSQNPMMEAIYSRVHAVGHLQAARFRGYGDVRSFAVNGKDQSEKLTARQMIIFNAEALVGDKAGSSDQGSKVRVPRMDRSIRGPIAVAWSQPSLRLHTGDSAKINVTLRDLTLAEEYHGLKSLAIDVQAGEGLTVEPERLTFAVDEQGEYQREQTFTLTVKADPTHANRATHLMLVAAPAEKTRYATPVQPTRLPVYHGVVVDQEQIWPRQFTRWVYAPRYVVAYDYLQSIAADVLLDPLGKRRFDGGSKYPQLLLATKEEDRRNKGQMTTVYKSVRLGGYTAFSPRLRGEEGEPKFAADMGQHPHGARSPFEYRFYESWLTIRYKDGEGKRITFDWGHGGRHGLPQPSVHDGIAREKAPEVELWINGDGKLLDKEPDEGVAVRARFVKPAGLRYGRCLLYPEASTFEQPHVSQPGDQAMGFTYCTADEFEALAKAWIERKSPMYVKPWGQGDMNR